MCAACLRFHERFVALKKEWYGAKGLLENSKYFVIEARLGEEVAQEGGLHDAYIDDLEVRVLSTTGGDANCSWVENPSKHNRNSCIFKVVQYNCACVCLVIDLDVYCFCVQFRVAS